MIQLCEDVKVTQTPSLVVGSGGGIPRLQEVELLGQKRFFCKMHQISTVYLRTDVFYGASIFLDLRKYKYSKGSSFFHLVDFFNWRLDLYHLVVVIR